MAREPMYTNDSGHVATWFMKNVRGVWQRQAWIVEELGLICINIGDSDTSNNVRDKEAVAVVILVSMCY